MSLCGDLLHCLLSQVLKETLVRHGFTFESETDTEVIPKLAKFVFDKANEVEGNFSLEIKFCVASKLL